MHYKNTHYTHCANNVHEANMNNKSSIQLKIQFNDSPKNVLQQYTCWFR